MQKFNFSLLVFLFFLGLAFFSSFGNTAGCHSNTPDYGPENVFPIIEASNQTTLIKTVKNGKLYHVTVPNSGGNTTTSFNLVHVWGTPYEMGYAQGQLNKDEGIKFIKETWTYMESQIENVISFLPQWLQELIANLGLDLALDFTYEVSREFTPQHFYDELHGIADAVGESPSERDSLYNTILRVHMIAGLTQGACSMIGGWGSALDPSGKTRLLQLRALDWDMNGPFRNYPQITVYHPNSDNGHAFANIGIMDFIGGLTGISETQLGISEIGASYPDSTFGSESRIGLPFIFLLRDILQYDYELDDAINRMINARRTCNLILGVGDGKTNSFRGFEYSYSVLYVMNDDNLRPYNNTWHPRINGLVYWGMDWDCPAYNLVLSSQLKKYYGKLSAPVGIRYLTAVEQSGDNHLAYYDLTNNEFWVSFAAPFNVAGPVAAYARQFVHFDAKALFKETAPQF